MAKVIVDPESTSLQERFVIIKTPRRDRKRYPEGCVTIYETEEEAYEQRNVEKKLHPAIAYGPSSSSESQRIYYLVRWLHPD